MREKGKNVLRYRERCCVNMKEKIKIISDGERAEVYVMFSYKPLLRLLVEKDMTKTQLREATGMSMNTLAKISKNEYVSMATLDSICKYFHCKIEDIIEFIE